MRVVGKTAFAAEPEVQAFVQQVFVMEHEPFDKRFDRFQLKLVLEPAPFVAWLEIEQLANSDLKISKTR